MTVYCDRLGLDAINSTRLQTQGVIWDERLARRQWVPLAGIRVADFGWILAVPHATVGWVRWAPM